jgi:hypothetical protein
MNALWHYTFAGSYRAESSIHGSLAKSRFPIRDTSVWAVTRLERSFWIWPRMQSQPNHARRQWVDFRLSNFIGALQFRMDGSFVVRAGV